MAGKSSVEAMETMIKKLTQLQQIQEDLQREVRQTYDIVGRDWNDQQYVYMGSDIDEIVQALSACYTTLSSSTTTLQGRKRALEAYLGYRH